MTASNSRRIASADIQYRTVRPLRSSTGRCIHYFEYLFGVAIRRFRFHSAVAGKKSALAERRQFSSATILIAPQGHSVAQMPQPLQ